MIYSTSLPESHDQIIVGYGTKKPWSKKVTKRRRRSVTKDREAIAMTHVSEPIVISDEIAPLVAITRPNLTLDTAQPTDNTQLGVTSEVNPLAEASREADREASEKPPRLRAWEHTTDVGKVTTTIRVLKATGNGYAFTLDLSPAEIKAAQANPKGFVDYFKRRIDRYLLRLLGYVPNYVFTVGVAPNGRLHLHGAIELNANELDRAERTLEEAGGIWANNRGKQYQCKVEPLYSPDIWANYCLRDCAKARRLIQGPVISITNGLRRRAKKYWIASR